MRRFITVLAGAAAAMLPFAAHAAPPIPANTTQFTTGGLDVTAPIDGNRQVAGHLTTVVNISAAGGTFTASDPLTIDVVVFIHDANGVVQATQVFANVKGGVAADLGGALPTEPVDFSIAPLGASLLTAINTARNFVTAGLTVSGGGVATGVRIGVVVNDGTVDGADGAETILDLADDAINQTILPDTAGPVLQQVLRDTSTMPERMIFVFDDDISNSTVGNLTDIDFESSATEMGVFAPFANVAFPGNPTIIGGNRALQFDIAMGQENLAPAIGQFARIALAGMPATNPDIEDLANNIATDQTARAIAAVTNPTITNAFWTDPILLGGDTTGTIRVNFSANLNNAAIGNLAFWQNALASISPSTGMTDLTVTAVAAFDPAFPASVFLTVTSAGTDSVARDGRGDATGGLNPVTYSLSLDTAVGTPPQDFLGTPITGTPTVAINDAIAPAAVGNPVALDENGDGVIDAFAWDFNESLDSTMLANAGFTLTKIAGTTHPFALFLENLATGVTNPVDAMNQATIAVNGDMTDEFQSAITGFALESQDDTGMNRLQQNNRLIIRIDSSLVDWDNDTNVGASDTDGEANPGTFDTDFAQIDVNATTSGIKDAAGNAPAGNFDNGGNVDDGASPVIARVDFSTGDNLAAGVQKPSEQDGAAGDDPTNNTAIIIFNETVNVGGIDETKFRFGNSAAERFAIGDFVALTGGNVLSLANSTGGFDPGDTFNVDADNGVADANGNDFAGASGSSLSVEDVTAPYVVLQQDINGNIIHSAFLGGIDANGFATTLSMTFSADVKTGTEGATTDWTIAGVGNPTTVTLNGNVITLTFPGNLISADVPVNVTYNGAAAAMRLAAAGGAMGTVGAMNDTFAARRVPTPNVDGEFTSVMDIAGTVRTDSTTVAPAGTKIFGMSAVPRAHNARVTMNGVTATIDDNGSLNAITNVILGLETDLFLLIDGEDMFFTNDKTEAGFVDAIVAITVQATTLSQVRLTGAGSSSGSGNVAVRITGGTVVLCWDVLRSDDGTAFSLVNKGYKVGGQPIVSSAVVTGDDGRYLLHMTAPIRAFNALIESTGVPIIMVVELPTGERFPVSSLLNAIDGLGALSFRALNRQNTPFDSDANLVFSPNLANVGMQTLYGGWNIMPHYRNSGVEIRANSVLRPAGVTAVTVASLINSNPLDQFVYFLDTNDDGMWTNADDDNSRLDGIAVSTRCLGLFIFVMNSNGVRTGDTIAAFTGGYAAGVFNPVYNAGNPVSVGVFQFGPPIAASTVFAANTGTNSFPTGNVTLGWALVTSPTTSAPGAFLTANGSDFLIIFNRTGHNAVDISTFSLSNSGSGAPEDDAGTIMQGMGLFLHK